MAFTTSDLMDVTFMTKGPPSKPSEITIKEVNNGFVVQAGCQEFVFSTRKALFNALELFYTDYEKAYKKYMKR
jgi:hypothetical protein